MELNNNYDLAGPGTSVSVISQHYNRNLIRWPYGPTAARLTHYRDPSPVRKLSITEQGTLKNVVKATKITEPAKFYSFANRKCSSVSAVIA